MILRDKIEAELMFRAREPQRNLFSARNQYLDLVGRDSFYGLLAQHGDKLFSDYKFERMYCDDNGRPCIPPSQMFILFLLQIHDKCSDYEAIERSRCDIRWLGALDLELGQKLCGRSTLQEFRARVHLNQAAEEQFKAILKVARRLGILKGPSLKVALDTTPILGRGAVKDTYNLIADGIRKLGGVLAKIDGVPAEQWAKAQDLSRYWEGSSLKGDAKIDWSDESERRVFLNSLVADADRILLVAQKYAVSTSEAETLKIKEASALLKRLISQDTEPDPNPPSKTPTTESTEECASQAQPSNETPSTNGPVGAEEAKAPGSSDQSVQAAEGAAQNPISQDTEPDPSPPSTPESTDETSEECAPQAEPNHQTPSANGPVGAEEAEAPGSSDQSAEASKNEAQSSESHVLGQMVRIRQGVAPDRLISVYDPEMRHGRKSASKRFDGFKLSVVVDTDSKLILGLDILTASAGDNQGALDLVARAATDTGMRVQKAIADCAYGDGATRQAFDEAGIDLSAKVPSPPANDAFHKGRFVMDLTNKIATCPAGQTTSDYDYAYHRHGTMERFRFPAAVCQACPHSAACLRSDDRGRNRGRTITLHPQEELLQRARRHQASEAFREDIKARQTVEHRQARMVQLGIRQARYMGREKTKLQALMTAMVANLGVIAALFSCPVVLYAVADPILALKSRNAVFTRVFRHGVRPSYADSCETRGFRLAS